MADRDEFVTINSVELALDGAWRVIDPTPLLGQGGFRGDDRLVPGVGGATKRPRVQAPLDVLLRMHVFGEKDETGTAHTVKRLGLRDNMEYLRSQLLPPYASDSVPIVHTFSDAATRTGNCIVNELRVVSTFEFGAGRAAVVAMDLVVLEGELTDPT